MARRSVVRYEQTPNSRFFLCRTCHTHIALFRELVPAIAPSQSVLVQSVGNLLIDTSEFHLRDNNTIAATVYCVGCFTNLGFIFVQLIHNAPRNLLRPGRIVIDLLLQWNGQEMIDPSRM